MPDTEKEALCARIDELCAEVERLRQQVDTAKHNQMRNAREYARLCHENDELQELVRDMFRDFANADYELKRRHGRTFMAATRYEPRMRGLGVEASE